MKISDPEPQPTRQLFLVDHSENHSCPVSGISQPSLPAELSDELVDNLAGVRGSISGILLGIAGWTMIYGMSRIIMF